MLNFLRNAFGYVARPVDLVTSLTVCATSIVILDIDLFVAEFVFLFSQVAVFNKLLKRYEINQSFN